MITSYLTQYRRSLGPSSNISLAHHWLVSRLIRRSPQRDPSLRDIRDSELACTFADAHACAPAGQVAHRTPRTPLSAVVLYRFHDVNPSDCRVKVHASQPPVSPQRTRRARCTRPSRTKRKSRRPGGNTLGSSLRRRGSIVYIPRRRLPPRQTVPDAMSGPDSRDSMPSPTRSAQKVSTSGEAK